MSLSLSLRLLKSAWQAESGAALVEAAVVLPVFLALVGGVYEFGFFLYQQQLAISGVRDAARYLALTADPTNVTSQAGARNLAVTGLIDGGQSRISGWQSSDVAVAVSSIDNSSGTYGSGSIIQIITVSTDFTDRTLGFLGLLGLKSPTISASHQERFVGGSARGQGPS